MKTFKDLPSNSLNDGIQFKASFDNGYGASIVQHSFSYGNKDQGLWELAVIGADGRINYDTPITNDVLGYLTEEDVEKTLLEIKALPKA